MHEGQKELLSITLTIAIVATAIFIVHRFIPSIIWAGIIVIATFPLYRHWLRIFGRNYNLAALLFTSMLTLVLLLPLSWLISIFVKELQLFINYLQTINKVGGAAPDFLKEIPFIGNDLVTYWDRNISHPGNVKGLMTNLHLTLTPASYYIKEVGANLFHRGFQFGFTLLTLFFFYRDGETLFKQINQIGGYSLGERWFRYADGLPSALRATVNGTILVGLGVGILMGICYLLVGFPAPTLVGFATAVAAMIPFLVPFVFTVVALVLVATGKMVSALIVIVWGTFVMFVADHFVKPVLIGGAIKLPFLAVLFGILGGVETLGLLGLFVGPIIMVLFVTLWQELQESESRGRTKKRALN